MKKLISLLTALTMLCALLPAVAEGADLTGLWYLTVLKDGETEMNPAVMGLKLTFDLSADGTVAASVGGEEGGEESKATWALNEEGALVITQDGEDTIFTVGDGTLEGDIGGIIGVFTREAPAAEEKPAPVAAESEDAFLGSWKVSRVDMDGSLIPANMLAKTGIDLGATLTLEAGKGSVQLSAFSIDLPAIEGATAFADGALTMTVEGLADPVAISLCDSGELYAVISVSVLDTALPMYFERAE